MATRPNPSQANRFNNNGSANTNNNNGNSNNTANNISGNNNHRRSNSKNFSNGSNSNSSNGTFFTRRNSSTNSNLNNTSGNNNNNGGGNNSSQSILSPQEFESAIKHMDDRLLYGLVKSIGCKATVTVGAGTIISGILFTPSELTENGVSLILKFPELIHLHPSDQSNESINFENLEETLIIYDKDLKLVEFENVDFNMDDESSNSKQSSTASNVTSSSSRSGFKTDTDISSASAIKERELQKWVPDDNDTFSTALDDISSSSGNWDQFEVNERKFGIQSTYDEALYTTTISKDAPDYEERLKKADRIAKEIESQAHNGSIHLAEERGIIVDDSGIDEEDKYSGVIRDNNSSADSSAGDRLLMGMLKSGSKQPQSELKPTTPGKYMPPRQRAANYHGDPAILASSATVATASSTNTAAESTSANEGTTPKDTPSTIPVKPTSAAATSPTVPTSTAPSTIPKKPLVASVTAQVSPTTATTPAAHTASLTASIPPKPTSSKAATSNNLSMSNEAKKLNVQSEINAMKEFSANLKVRHKIPQDLLPILSKDTNKQQEILKKIEQSQQQAEAEPVAAPTAAAAAAAAPSPTPTPAVIPKKKLDPKNTPTFKMNPTAASFSPSNFTNKNSPLSLNSNLNSPQNQPSNTATGSLSSTSSSSQSVRHKRTPLSFFGPGRVPSADKPLENKLATHFNILQSAKLEQLSKSSSTTSYAVYMINIEKSFATQPTWPSTIDESYKSKFSKQPEYNPQSQVQIQLQPQPQLQQRKMYMYHPQSQHQQQHHHQQQQSHPMMMPQHSPNPMMMPQLIDPQQLAAQQAAVAAQHQSQQQQFMMPPAFNQFISIYPPGPPPVGMTGPGGHQVVPQQQQYHFANVGVPPGGLVPHPPPMMVPVHQNGGQGSPPIMNGQMRIGTNGSNNGNGGGGNRARHYGGSHAQNNVRFGKY
ncbi:hypothetical protein CANARDRAFT_26448 [[Candida] arabinofermentans NRRL YB-2248]|uniref:LsmAD domain-containing protein n=1 Tax=[Candida] arabinofermentans NRRL YB-2248 TaxID=983967 RepID=A0A1E4T972_9ASCO|nr:hypothetical protein CANARDRAFT_26448 [[Candida] arabinofermentans NRRL YB-2248]